jgi:hypothetical protein
MFYRGWLQLKTITVIALIVVAVLFTSAAWIVLLNNPNPFVLSNGNTNSHPTRTPLPTFHPTQPPITSPTPVLTSTPTLTPTSGTTTPSTPEFSLQYADHSYDVPQTYKTDPYTGKTVVNQSGYRVTNQTIDVTITNQPFTSGVQNGNVTALYYNVEHKGHFEDWPTDSSSYDYVNSNIQASTLSSTLVSYPLQYWNIPAGGMVDRGTCGCRLHV